MKKEIIAVLFVLTLFMLPTLVLANPDPFSTLTIWPVDTPEGAEGPIVTGSPADLIIYNRDNSRVLDDVWLLLVINELTYDNLASISTNTSLSFLPEHFEEIPGTASPSDRIPPTESGPGGWPGIEFNDQYDVGSLRSKLGIADGESMWYSVGDLDSSSGWIDHGPPGLNKHDPEYLTVTVVSGGGNLKVLVLALGHSNDFPDNPILNVCSPYTRSTFIVSELGTILLALTPLSAFGLHKIRHKIRKKKRQES
jgi:hypothetical protein